MSRVRESMRGGRRVAERREPIVREERGAVPAFPDLLVLVKIDDTSPIGSGTNRYLYTGKEAWIDGSNGYALKTGGRTFQFTNPAEGGNSATNIDPGGVDPTTFPGTFAYKPLSGYGFITPTRGSDGSLRWAWVCGASNIDGEC